MSAQSKYEYYADRALDRDLADTIAAECCNNCGRELVDDKCEKCEKPLEIEE